MTRSDEDRFVVTSRPAAVAHQHVAARPEEELGDLALPIEHARSLAVPQATSAGRPLGAAGSARGVAAPDGYGQRSRRLERLAMPAMACQVGTGERLVAGLRAYPGLSPEAPAPGPDAAWARRHSTTPGKSPRRRGVSSPAPG